MGECPQQKSRADEEHDAEADLRDDHQTTRQVPCAAAHSARAGRRESSLNRQPRALEGQAACQR